jgi:hypothetical protein
MRIKHLTIILALAASPALAQATYEDGTYTAKVKTDSGTYKVPVVVEDGEVTKVKWPNGGNMRVRGGELDGNEASGRNSEGDRIKVEIEE